MTKAPAIHPALQKALDKRGYETLTPVQTAVLEHAESGVDLLVSAQTGSGKTVAFGIAIAPTLLGDADHFPKTVKEPLALVIAPTRELAMQVCRELDWLYDGTNARTVTCVGGMDMRAQRRDLAAGAHLVVGTPGRLRDHLERRSIDLGSVRAVILDEADEMLDMGFREDLEVILKGMPEDRRTLMFSATVPRTIATLAKRYQKNAVRISTKEEQSPHGDITYSAMRVAPRDRENAIINALRYHDAQSTLIFCSTRAEVTRLSSRLTNRGLSVVTLSGELTQKERSHALQAMRDQRARICVATDVAARGIDLPSLDLVIHADLPNNRETFLHRSGRTGRAGRKGQSILIVPQNRYRAAMRLFSSAGITAEWTPPPTAQDILTRDRERIMADPALEEALTEDEAAFADALLDAHGAQQVAAAYLRLQQEKYPAPEDLMEQGSYNLPADEKPGKNKRERDRGNFEGSAWFLINTGRDNNAEPRWLLPLICRVGKLTNTDVGAIRIDTHETYVEIAAHAVDGFSKNIAQGIDEKGITITPSDAPSAKAGFSPKKHRKGGPRPKAARPKLKGKDRVKSKSRKKQSPGRNL